MRDDRLWLVALLAPAAIVFTAFFLLPLARLFLIRGSGPNRRSRLESAFVTRVRFAQDQAEAEQLKRYARYRTDSALLNVNHVRWNGIRVEKLNTQ